MRIESIKDDNWLLLEERVFEDPYDKNLRSELTKHILKTALENTYFARDVSIIDYDPVSISGLQVRGDKQVFFRGPKIKEGEKYILLLGAGDGFGSMVKTPFSHLLEKYLNIKIINLSRGGTSIVYWLRLFNNLVDLANNAEMVFITVTSLRSIYFYSIGFTGLQKVFRKGKEVDINAELRNLFHSSRNQFENTIEEIAKNSLEIHKDFFEKNKVPKFLFLLPNKHSGIPENTAELSLKKW